MYAQGFLDLHVNSIGLAVYVWRLPMCRQVALPRLTRPDPIPGPNPNPNPTLWRLEVFSQGRQGQYGVHVQILKPSPSAF